MTDPEITVRVVVISRRKASSEKQESLIVVRCSKERFERMEHLAVANTAIARDGSKIIAVFDEHSPQYHTMCDAFKAQPETRGITIQDAPRERPVWSGSALKKSDLENAHLHDVDLVKHPLYVEGTPFFDFQDAIDFACQRSLEIRQEGRYGSIQITKHFKDGINGYPGQRAVVASFRDGQDMDLLAADEDGEPDIGRRARAFRSRADKDELSQSYERPRAS